MPEFKSRSPILACQSQHGSQQQSKCDCIKRILVLGLRSGCQSQPPNTILSHPNESGGGSGGGRKEGVSWGLNSHMGRGVSGVLCIARPTQDWVYSQGGLDIYTPCLCISYSN